MQNPTNLGSGMRNKPSGSGRSAERAALLSEFSILRKTRSNPGPTVIIVGIPTYKLLINGQAVRLRVGVGGELQLERNARRRSSSSMISWNRVSIL